jgi:hypothetical protein
VRWRDTSTEWTPFFAWQPYLIDGQWAWLERLERRCKLAGIVDVWEYRLPASCDTHPKGGDVKQAPSPMSGAVGSEADETPNLQHPHQDTSGVSNHG